MQLRKIFFFCSAGIEQVCLAGKLWKKNSGFVSLPIALHFRRAIWYAMSSWKMMCLIDVAALCSGRLGSANQRQRETFARVSVLLASPCHHEILNSATPRSTLHGPRFSLIEQKMKKKKKNAREELFVRKQSRRENGEEWVQCDQRQILWEEKTIYKNHFNCSIL